MATNKQIAANRRNAQRSTGPRSPEGKSASSQNALRTGIYAAAEAVLPHEDPKDLSELAAEYHTHYQPQSPAERCLVDSLVSDEWLLRRFRRIESELLADRVVSITGDTRPLGDAYDMIDKTLERLQRRVNATRKSYLKTLEAVESLHAARLAAQPPAPAPEAVRKPAATATQPQPNQPLTAQIGFVSQPASSIVPVPPFVLSPNAEVR